MTANLVRVTSYLDPNLLIRAKKTAIDRNVDFYELLNEALRSFLSDLSKAKVSDTAKPFKYSDHFGVYSLKMKKKVIKRADAYE
jgi:hypothetical protein